MSSALVDAIIIGTFSFFAIGSFLVIMAWSNWRNKNKEQKHRDKMIENDFKRFMEEKHNRELYK